MTTTTKPDPHDVYKTAKTELENLNWTVNVLGNEFRNPNMPNAEIRLLYSGGLIHIQGWHRVGTTEVHYKAQAENHDQAELGIHQVTTALWNEHLNG
jgi:hypothetical protein